MTSLVIWDKDTPDEVWGARRMFENLTRAGYLAYKAEGAQGEVPHAGELISVFDPAAEQIILQPASRTETRNARDLQRSP